VKRVYISDVVHEELKKEAASQGRTLQWLIEDRLVNNVYYKQPVQESQENGPTPKIIDTAYKRDTGLSARTKGVILKEIKAQEAHIKDLENQTQINQDPELLEYIAEEKAKYQELWNEYNSQGE
jgi:hypothetical protein